jgi:hypothetical protein
MNWTTLKYNVFVKLMSVCQLHENIPRPYLILRLSSLPQIHGCLNLFFTLRSHVRIVQIVIPLGNSSLTDKEISNSSLAHFRPRTVLQRPQWCMTV